MKVIEYWVAIDGKQVTGTLEVAGNAVTDEMIDAAVSDLVLQNTDWKVKEEKPDVT